MKNKLYLFLGLAALTIGSMCIDSNAGTETQYATAPAAIVLISICAKIGQNMVIDCDNPIIAGAEDELMIINYADWKDATITRNGTNPQIIEDIALPSGIVGYIWQGQNGSIMPKCTMVKAGKYQKRWKHTVSGFVFSNSPDIKAELNTASKGRFVVIVKKNFEGTDGNAAYEIYGDRVGLLLEECEKDDNNTETQGAWSFMFATPEENLEPFPQASLFINDLATTKAVYDSLPA